jgi:2'-5' RNA ligase
MTNALYGLFFAAIPDAQAAVQIERRAMAFQKELGWEGVPLSADQFHITLYYLGAHNGMPQGIVAKAVETAAAIKAAPFEVTFDRAKSFSGKSHSRPLVLCSRKTLAGLSAFQRKLRAALKQAGLDNWPQPSFTPHVTLLYDRRGVPEQDVEPVSWTVNEFALVRSFHGLSRHEPLARWPLVA